MLNVLKSLSFICIDIETPDGRKPKSVRYF